MTLVTVSDKGQVIRAQVKRPFAATSVEAAFGMLKAKPPTKSSNALPQRKLADFDVASAMKASKP